MANKVSSKSPHLPRSRLPASLGVTWNNNDFPGGAVTPSLWHRRSFPHQGDGVNPPFHFTGAHNDYSLKNPMSLKITQHCSKESLAPLCRCGYFIVRSDMAVCWNVGARC